MLPLFILGVALFVGILLLGRWFVSTEPKVLIKVFGWVSLLVLVVVGLFLLLTGRVAWALFTLPALFGWFMRFRAIARTAKNYSKMAAAGSGGGGGSEESSQVETGFFRMVLNHANGDMDGEILTGQYQGKWLNELSMGELLFVLDECRGDEQSESVLQAYLDRLYPDWRSNQNEGSKTGSRRPHSGDGAMGREDALDVLGLTEGATKREIKEAHRRLMSGMHPDHGGSTYLASKINQAKDVLLGN